MLISLTAAALLISLADQDGVIATAPRGAGVLPAASSEAIEAASPSTTVTTAASPHGLSTAEQINNWIGQGRSDRAASERPWASPFEEEGPRKPHGEISAGIGTGGYRDFSAAVHLPLGEKGTLNLAVRQSKNDPYGYYPYDHPHDVWGGGWRGPYSPLSALRDNEFFPMGRSSPWMRERLTNDAYGTPNSSSKSVSVGVDFTP